MQRHASAANARPGQAPRMSADVPRRAIGRYGTDLGAALQGCPVDPRDPATYPLAAIFMIRCGEAIP